MKIYRVAPKFIYKNSSIFEELSTASKGVMSTWIKKKKIHSVFIAVVDRVCVGWSGLDKDFKWPSVFVNPAYRHKEIGMKLWRKAFKVAKPLLLADFK